jgi:hypothetical protein
MYCTSVTADTGEAFSALAEESAGAATVSSAVAIARGAAIAMAMASIERLIKGHSSLC